MKRLTYLFLLAALVLPFLHANAQEDSTATGPQFKLSMNYNTRLNYFGRTDSLRSSGVFPMAEMWFTKGFYVNAAPIFVNNSQQNMDYAGTITTLGFQHVTDKSIASLYVMKPFYEEGSDLVQSALKAQGGFNLSFLNKFLNINGGADVKFSNKTDLGVTAGVDHLIRIENSDNSVVVLDPSFYTYAGTQQFQHSYYKKKNSGFLNLPGNTELITEDVQKFNVLAYEFSMPAVYAKNRWMVIATPSYIIPQNLVVVPNRPDLSERGENTFYATLALKYTF